MAQGFLIVRQLVVRFHQRYRHRILSAKFRVWLQSSLWGELRRRKWHWGSHHNPLHHRQRRTKYFGFPPFNHHSTKAPYSFVYHPEDCNGLVKRRSSTASQPNLRHPRDDAGVRSVVYRSFKNESCSIQGTQLRFYLQTATRSSRYRAIHTSF